MSERPISRRDFLKLLGLLGVGLSGFGGFLELFNKKRHMISLTSPSSLLTFPESNYYSQTALAQTAGSWSPVQNVTAVPIHAALTYTGKIFYFAGSGYCIDNSKGPYIAKLLDPATNTETNVTMPEDLWCGGAAQLPNGNIFVCGGTLPTGYDTDVNNCNGRWHGANYAYEFDVASGNLNKMTNMKQGRWYPTCVTLTDGKVIIVSGADDYGTYNYLTEIYDPSTKSLSIKYDPTTGNTYCAGSDAGTACAGAGSPCYGGPNQGTAPWLSLYPRMFLMPSGLVFQCGQIADSNLWDPSTGTWTHVNTTSQYRDYGTLVLLPLQNTTTERGKVMIVGGSVSDTVAATKVVEFQDFNAGTSTNPVLTTAAQSLNFGRKFINPIILPNGKIAIFAGSSQAGNLTNAVLTPEIYDPENPSQGWLTLPNATVPRVYHGIAILLPDGSVWTASRYS